MNKQPTTELGRRLLRGIETATAPRLTGLEAITLAVVSRDAEVISAPGQLDESRDHQFLWVRLDVVYSILARLDEADLKDAE